MSEDVAVDLSRGVEASNAPAPSQTWTNGAGEAIEMPLSKQADPEFHKEAPAPRKGSLVLTLAYRPREIEDVISLVQEGHSISRFSDTRFSIRKTAKVLSKAITMPDTYSLIIVRTADGRAVGYVFFSIGELHICDEDLFVTVDSLYVGQKFRKTLVGGKASKMLVDAVKLFAKNRAAKGIFVYGTMGIEDESLGKLMQKSGFEFLGRNWVV